MWYDDICQQYMMLLLYDIGYVNDYVVGLYYYIRWWLLMLQVLWNNVCFMVSYLIKLIIWGYGDSHNHCTRRFRIVSFGKYVACYVDMNYKILNVNMTLWEYVFGCDHVWCSCDTYLVYALFYVHQRLSNDLARFFKQMALFMHDFKCFMCIYLPILNICDVLTPYFI